MSVNPGKRCLRGIERCGRLGHAAERAGTITFLMIAGLAADLIALTDPGKNFRVANFDRLQWISGSGAGSPARGDRRQDLRHQRDHQNRKELLPPAHSKPP